VSAGLEHQECSEALAAYALGAVPDDEAARVQQHLSGCRECRAQLDWLGPAVDVLPASVPPIDPPPELKTRLMDIVEAEAELLRAAGETADLPPQPAPSRWRWRWAPGGRWLGAIAVAAACVVAVVVVLAVGSGGGGVRTIRAQLAPGLAGARASLTVRGSRAELVVNGLPAPAADHVDELWVKRGSAPPTPAGTFVVQSGSVLVGHPVQRGDLVLVTTEPGRGTAAPTTRPFIVVKV
jgi:anti-sigma-K factor RskA